MTESHLADLEREHRTLDLEIEAELAHPASDPLKIGDMKRRKLRLKEEIERLRHGEEHAPLH